MPVILLLLGIVTTLAGLVLVASGVTVHDGTLDTEAVTPGTIAAVGGLLLIGMALAVRELQRIERALAARPMPRTVRPGEVPSPSAAAETPEISVRIPFPPKTRSSPPVGLSATTAAPVLAEDAAIERLRGKFPILTGREQGPVAEEDGDEVRHAVAGPGGANGGAPARVVPKVDVKTNPVVVGEKTRVAGISAFLAGRSRRDGQTATAQVAQVEAMPPTDAPAEPPGLAPSPASAIIVLKSGVVEGMAYTLYSDGSIEAQLPQGTLRFGSITALREHIDAGT
jgi:hypothetical protein